MLFIAPSRQTSPPFPGHNMIPGQKLRRDWFPIYGKMNNYFFRSVKRIQFAFINFAYNMASYFKCRC